MRNPSKKLIWGALLLLIVGGVIFLGGSLYSAGFPSLGAVLIVSGGIAGFLWMVRISYKKAEEQARREEEEEAERVRREGVERVQREEAERVRREEEAHAEQERKQAKQERKQAKQERKQAEKRKKLEQKKDLEADFGKWLEDVGIDMECKQCLGRSFFVLQLSAHGRSFQARCKACYASKWFKTQFGEGLNVADFEARGLHGEWYFEAPSLPAATKAQDLERSRRVSEKVKNEVWRRDKGRCTACGSNQLLEYDHIIPFSKGGSNTARNIQLLCEGCNRQKSAHI